MNDIILNMLANDSFTVSDFRAVGLTAENTTLKSEEKYKASPKIQNNVIFLDSQGNFDENKFHQFYLNATEFYNNLADDTYIEDITKNTYYSKYNVLAPEGSKVKDDVPLFVTIPNPFLQSRSTHRIGIQGDRELSISEIAQSLKIYDSKKQLFTDESVNDRALGSNPIKWLGDLFSEPLVIAQWDEDGEHIDPLSGERRKHKKGDYKYNDEGTFYYETLNGRDVYGKLVLNRMNTLTVDGSPINKYDFFDSDDLELKSIIGSTMKNLALVGSMFIPYVGGFVTAANIASQSVGLLGALGKMFFGSDSETANNMHAWAKTVNRHSTTEYASQNTWCWENMINLVGDVIGQVKEQRFLFTHVPALIKGTKGIKAQNTKTYDDLVKEGAEKIKLKTASDYTAALGKISGTTLDDIAALTAELTAQYNASALLKSQAALESYMKGYRHLGSIMSKTYMTGLVVLDTYGEAKAAGASDLEAFALTLGYAAAEAVLLNTGVGEWMMPELHGDKLRYRSILNAMQKEVKPLSESINTTTKEGRLNLFKKIFNIGKKIRTDEYAKQQFISKTPKGVSIVAAHATSEAVEELSEELLADFSKSAFNTINWLRGDETRVTAWENVGDRYLMSLIGGFAGGGLSSIGTDFSYAKLLGLMTQESAILEIIYMTNNDKINDFLKFVDKNTIGNKYLSNEIDENGNFKPGTKENNQDKDLKTIIHHLVDLIRNTINAEGAKLSENSLFDALTLKDLRYLQLRNTSTAGLYFQEYNSLISQIYQKSELIRLIMGDSTNTDTKKKELTDAEQGRVAELKKELNDLRVKKDAFIQGKKSAEFIQTALYEASPVLHGHKRHYTFVGFAEDKTKKKISELTQSEIDTLKQQYKAYKSSDMKNHVMDDARQFVDLVGLASSAILLQGEYLTKMLKENRNTITALLQFSELVLNQINVETDPDEFIPKALNILTGLTGKTLDVWTNDLVEVLTRMEYIKNKPLDKYYNEEMRQYDIDSVKFEAFANWVDTIIDSYISQGYIHPELKNTLINTIKTTIKYLNTIKEHEGDENVDSNILRLYSAYRNLIEDGDIMDFADDRINKFTNQIKYLNNRIIDIQELSTTPVVLLLELFKLATSVSDLSVNNVLTKVNELLNMSSNDLETFAFSDDLDSQLDEVEDLINVLQSAIYATRVDKSSMNNTFGYSKILNELNKKYGNDTWIELAEIEGDKAELIHLDLNILKSKIQFARKLNSINSGLKLLQLQKIGYNKLFMFYNRFMDFLDIVKLKFPDLDFSMFDDIETSLIKSHTNKDVKNRNFSFTPEEKVIFERETLQLDDAIYLFFLNNTDALTNENLSKLLSFEHIDYFNLGNELLSDKTEYLDDGSFVFNLAAKAAIKSSDFYNILRTTFTEKKAPVPMQEQAAFLNIAMAQNGNVLNRFAKIYAKNIYTQFETSDENTKRTLLSRLGLSITEINEYIKRPELFRLTHYVEKFFNIVLTEGIAGSGKSGGVFYITVEMLKKINPKILSNIFFSHSTTDNAQESLNSLDITGKTFSSNKKENSINPSSDLIKYFYDEFDLEKYDEKVKLSGDTIQIDFKLKTGLNNSDIPSAIFIDEASRYDYIQMKLLSQAAQYYGIPIFAAADMDQISASSSIQVDKDTEINFSPHRLNFIRSPKLGASFRTLNSLMVLNLSQIQAKLNDSKDSKFTISYWEDDDEIRGFKVHNKSDINSIKVSIEKIKTSLFPNEKIGYLYVSEKDSIYKELKKTYGDLIEGHLISDVLGLEGNYYIIDLSREIASGKSWPDPEILNQEFYTAFTRAKIGGVIINNDINEPIDITNIRNESSELLNISQDAIKKVSIKRKEIFDLIFENSAESIIPYEPLEKIKLLPIIESTNTSGFTTSPTIESLSELLENTLKENIVNEQQTNEETTENVNNLPLQNTDYEYCDDKDLEENNKDYDNLVHQSNISQENEIQTSENRLVPRIYTFNSYETGVLWDRNKIDSRHFNENEKIGKHTKFRIDDVNGLIKLGIVNKNSDKSQCLDILAQFHSLLMSETNNDTLKNKLNQILSTKYAIDFIDSIQFGIKSSAMSSGNREYGVEDDNLQEWFIFNKHIDEKSEYSQQTDRGDDISYKPLVAVFRNAKGEKILEITLGTLNSPFTIGLMKSGNDFIFPEINAIISNIPKNPNGQNIYDACIESINTINNLLRINTINSLDVGAYESLRDLFKMFIFTSNAFYPIGDNNFNLASQSHTPPTVIPEKGTYGISNILQYEGKKIDLEEFVKDERVVVSDIYIPKDNKINGKIYNHIKSGHSGVFISYNKSLRPDLLLAIYERELDSDNKTVAFVYIIPPSATVEEYIINSENAYKNTVNNDNLPVLSIGNKWTSFRILLNIINADQLNNSLFKSGVTDLDENLTLEKLKDLVSEMTNIESSNFDSDDTYKLYVSFYKSSGLLEEQAKLLAKKYIIKQKQLDLLNQNVENTNLPRYKIFNRFFTMNLELLGEKRQDVLKEFEKYNSDVIKYKVKYSKQDALGSLFIKAEVNTHNKYQLDTINENGYIIPRPFKINSKVDPPVFDIPLIDNAVINLSKWTLQNENNPKSIKQMSTEVRAATEVYKRDTKTQNQQNNFQKLKSDNKSLFENNGLLSKYTVKNDNDLTKTQLEFAKEIINLFNSEPNHLGIVYIDEKNNIKLYAIEINNYREIKGKESETNGLEGITIGKELVIDNNSSQTFESKAYNYTILKSSNGFLINKIAKESDNVETKVQLNEVSDKNIKELCNKILGEQNLPPTVKNMVSAALEKDSLSETNRNNLKGTLSRRIKTKSENVQALIDLLNNNISLLIGDIIKYNDNYATVLEINETIITLSNSLTVDITKTDVYKIDKKINCTQNIEINV